MSEANFLGNTTFGPPPSPYDKYYWLVCETILVILTVLTLYINGCLLKHAIAKGSKRNGSKIWQKLCLKWLAVASSAFMLVRLCGDHILAFYGWQDDQLCFITVTVSTVFFSLVVASVYLFLWVRQSIFYADPLMRQIVNPFVTFLSWFTLAFLVLCGIAIGVLYNVPQVTGWEYKATSEGCKEVSADTEEILPFVTAAFTITFQVAQLALFVYPLWSRQTAKFRMDKSNGSSDNNHSSTLSHSGEHKPESPKLKIKTRVQEPRRSSTPVGRAMSPLARVEQQFTFERPHTGSEDTGAESGPETPVKLAGTKALWSKNPTIKRDTIPENIRQPRRKTVMARLSSVRPGSVFYRGSRNCSVSSENMDSPAGSDTETPSTSLFGTLRRAVRPTKSRTEKKENQRGKNMVIMMKKYAKLMAICVFTDLVSALLQINFVLPELIYIVIFDVNLMVNLLCVVMTFREWKSILFPCLKKEKDKSTKTIDVRNLKRRPTPLKKKRTGNRLQELKKEGRRMSSPSQSRRSSGSISGYDSADSAASHSPIYKYGSRETRTLL